MINGYTIIAAIIISIIIGTAIHVTRDGNNPANDDKFFRTARRVVNYRPPVRRNTDRRGGRHA